MFWYLLLIICVCVLITGIVIEIRAELYIFQRWLIIVSILVLLVVSPFVITEKIQHKKEVETYKKKYEYYENIQENILQNAGAINKIAELNEWLYDAQYSYENYNFFSLYENDVMELKPIK